MQPQSTAMASVKCFSLTVIALLVALPSLRAQQALPDQLDTMGPLLLTKDGQLQRLSNWAELTQQERDAAVRHAQRRNAKRLEALKRDESGKASGSGGKSPLAHLHGLMGRVQRWTSRVGQRVRGWFRRGEKPLFEDGTTTAESKDHEDETVATPLDFAPEYVRAILAGTKTATTRWLTAEPHLSALLGVGRVARATCVRCERAEEREQFATLEVTHTSRVRFADLTDELAAIEGFDGRAVALQQALRGFYPTVGDDALLAIYHFRVVSAAEWSVVVPSADSQRGSAPRSATVHPSAAAEVEDEDDSRLTIEDVE